MGASNSKTRFQNSTAPPPPPPYQEKYYDRYSPSRNSPSSEARTPTPSPLKASPPKARYTKNTPPTASPSRKIIRWGDVSQWKWSTNQCREWLSAVFIDSFNLQPLESADLARNLKEMEQIYTARHLTGGSRTSEVIEAMLVHDALLCKPRACAIPKNIYFDCKQFDKSFKDRVNEEMLKKYAKKKKLERIARSRGLSRRILMFNKLDNLY
ncbi:uncharacterized protein PAC_03223 [Phialocephala subalpina]|uniref:Uncharacterized protein n=1 Tax=Phialocephala subalpina TaxID=576137 RepID=A0A1L7WKQ3_9HELO|nr:uncharacterized protein PAC_03223 [Phialocephala subalpina]